MLTSIRHPNTLARLITVLLLAVPLVGQETFVHQIPPGCTATMDSSTVTITCPPLTITTPVTMPQATEDIPYSASLADVAKPTGGVPPYTYALLAKPEPPAWLSLSPTGIFSGTPTVTGPVVFDFSVTDSSKSLVRVVKGSFYVAQNTSTHPSGR